MDTSMVRMGTTTEVQEVAKEPTRRRGCCRACVRHNGPKWCRTKGDR